MQLSWKQMVVIIVVIVSVIGFLPFGVLNSLQNPAVQADNGNTVAGEVSGIAHTAVSIAEYEPYLLLRETNVSQEQLDRIGEMEEVEEVRLHQGSYLVTVLRRDDLESVHAALREQNLTPVATAIVAFPPSMEVEANGEIEVVVTNGIQIRQVLDYILPVGESVNASIGIVTRQGQAVAFNRFEFVRERETLNATARIAEMREQFTTYSIPWEERDGINVTALRDRFGNVQYVERSYVERETNITVQEQLQWKNLEYVQQIVENRIFIASNFTDRERIEEDIGEIAFPDSTVTISGERVWEREGEVHYIYEAELQSPSEEYRWAATQFDIEWEAEKEIGEEVEVRITIERLGRTVINILNAEVL
ncbi:MAG TPA: hypothetical protein VJH24_05380 [Candidatus Bilamarchaeaceae archaeon]|nr:hypothetical protein [Candidatus Bilamarchaeaceae archaeon]